MHGKRPLRCFGVSTTKIAAVATLVLALGLLSGPSMAQGTASGIYFQFLDDANGFDVSSAEIKWARVGQSSIPPLSQSAVSSSEGRLPLRLSPGEYVFEISASGYKSMRGHYAVTLGSMPTLNVHLDPLVPPEELREAAVAGELRKGMELDHGFVTDALTHRPIAHVEIRLQQSGAAAVTNSRGYFEMMAPAQDTSHLRDAEEFPPSDTLTASAPGYKAYILTGLWHDPQSWKRINIELTPGTGTTHEDTTPRALMPPGSLPKEPPPPAPSPHPIPKFLLRWLSGPPSTLTIPRGQ
jgi:hypothetical protein